MAITEQAIQQAQSGRPELQPTEGLFPTSELLRRLDEARKTSGGRPVGDEVTIAWVKGQPDWTKEALVIFQGERDAREAHRRLRAEDKEVMESVFAKMDSETQE